MNYIQGKDCLFQVDLGAGYKNFACVKNFSVDLETEEKEITFTGDGNWKDYDYKALSYTIQLDSVLVIQDGITPTAFDGLEYQTGFLELKYRMLFEQGTNVKVIRGSAIVKKSSLSATANQLADSSITLLGKGAFIDENTLPALVNLRLQMSGNDVVGALGKFKLINSDGEIVFDSGELPQASGGNLANPFDLTTQIQKGNYYIYWQIDTDSFGNTFTLDASPTENINFQDNVTENSSFPAQLYDFTVDRFAHFILGISTPPPSCVVPAIIGSPALPDATTFTDYTYAFSVSGTSPFNISNVTKPSWMSIAVSGSTILFSGKPRSGDAGTGIAVSFDINNACGTTSFADTINVIASSTLVTINYSFTTSGSLSVFRLNQNGNPLIVPLTASGSGSSAVNGGDILQVQISKAGGTKHTTIVDSVSGTIYDNTTGSTNQSFSWTVILGHAYTITTIIS